MSEAAAGDATLGAPVSVTAGVTVGVRVGVTVGVAAGFYFTGSSLGGFVLPSGDVMPIPEGAGPVRLLCATAGAAPRSRIAVAIGRMRLIELSITQQPGDRRMACGHH